jgi:hypothetical protein
MSGNILLLNTRTRATAGMTCLESEQQTVVSKIRELHIKFKGTMRTAHLSMNAIA